MHANASIATTRRDPLAYLLLMAVGCLIALMLPLARMAMDAGMTPLAYAFWQALGGGALLWLWNRPKPGSLPSGRYRYFLVSGLTAIAIPNTIAFLVVAEVGSGLTSTLYALPSLITYALTVMLRLDRISVLRLAGLMLGVLGCLRILVPDRHGISVEALPWMLLGLLVPLSLAIGNVYRTVAWPVGAGARDLAPGMLLSGALLVALVLGASGRAGTILVPGWEAVPVLAIQAVLSALAYLGFFELQRRSSPVFLSQLGFVIAPAGLLLGYVFFGERFGLEIWLGVGILMAGVLLANWKP